MATASSSGAAPAKPSIGILSIGDMGLGIAKLLKAHDYTVVTSTAGRSQSTLNRIKAAQVIPLPTDDAFVAESDIILRIVPPRDAVATARRVVEAGRSLNTVKQREERSNRLPGYTNSIVYIDLNAISPRTARVISGIISSEASPTTTRRSSFSFSSSDIKPLKIDFLDGGIIGAPPSQSGDRWKKPALVVSGPNLDALLTKDFQKTLNMKNVGAAIGPASTLKSCFASLTKGMTALSILSYTTANTSGVLPELRVLLKEFVPNLFSHAESGLCGMPPKAYRWVEEMGQIGETFADEGGFSGGLGGQAVYDGVAEIYRLVAEDTVLGQETVEKRKRGKTVEDVAGCIAEGVKKRRRGSAPTEQELGLTWRGSWS